MIWEHRFIYRWMNVYLIDRNLLKGFSSVISKDATMMNYYWGATDAKGKLPSNYDITPSSDSLFREGKEIHFSCPVSQKSIDKLIKLSYEVIWNFHKKDSGYENEDGNPLRLIYHINSGGGSVTAMFKFVDFCNVVKAKHGVKITTIATGFVASAATIMCLMGDRRIITAHCSYMIHELSGGMEDKFTFMKSTMVFLQGLHDKMVNQYVNHSGLTKEQVEDLLSKESWMFPEKCLEYKLVDEII